MSLTTPRDTIQISLGPSANAVTAHSLNLQGLAATSGSDETNVCDPQTTLSLQQHRWVPRVLLVDEPTCFFVSNQVSNQAQLITNTKANTQLQASQLLASSSPFGIQSLDPALTLQHPEPQWNQFFESASALAYSTHSRYYQEPQAKSYRASSANPRHVNWDDDDDDDGGQVEEDPLERQQRMQRERSHWQRHTQAPLQAQLSELMGSGGESSSPQPPPVSWMDYWMPPYSDKSKVALPFSHQSQMVAHWDAYPMATDDHELRDWKEDVLFERLRHLLEDCDTCQGVMITTEGYGIYAGLTTSLLQEFQEECKSAGRLVFHITNPSKEHEQTSTTPQKDDDIPTVEKSVVDPWQPAHVQRVRQNMSSGLALNDFTQHAHIVLPLHLDIENKKKSLFQASGQMAMNLEAATLPIRLNDQRDPRYQIGLMNAPFFGQGGGDSRWGTTAQRLTMGELLTCLQPSSQYKVLELDALDSTTMSNNTNIPSALWDQFKAGTSVERDRRMREGRGDSSRFRARDIPPGTWLQDVQHGGLLSSMSPLGETPIRTNRSLHHHFALSTSVRPVLQDELSNYVTCLVQGMGIQYRPERSVATVLNQTVGRLTHDAGYGAGAYWKSLVADLQTPVVCVLGNTTRSYPFLNQVATNMKTVLGPRYRGYYQRDVMNGVLPESEDCEEALANGWDLRDVYMPPEGSGLVPAEADIDY